MYIRKLKESDAVGMLEWIKDPNTATWSQIDTEKQNMETVLEFIKKCDDSGNIIHRAIVNDEDIYLGTVSLKNIDMNIKSAEYAISMRRSAQGTGAAQIGTREILKYGFEKLGLERIYWYTFSDNVKATRFYEKIGAYYEGEFRKAMKVKGIVHDVKWYSVLKDEYLEVVEKINICSPYKYL